MSRFLQCPPVLVASLGICLLTIAGVTEAQTSLSRLGLSAAPDSYVPTIEVDSEEPFDLHIIAKGPDGIDVLPFDLASLEWAVYTPCCGAVYSVVGFEYNPDLDHVGFPFTGVQTTGEVCIEDDFLHLATLTLILHVDEPGFYLLPAGAIGPAYDCDGGSHLFLDLTVEASVDGGITPNTTSTWGGMKGLYR